MFDDAIFYCRLAEDPKSYGIESCTESRLYLKISELDVDNDLLDFMESMDDCLLDAVS